MANLFNFHWKESINFVILNTLLYLLITLFNTSNVNQSAGFLFKENTLNSKININISKPQVIDPAFMIVLSWKPSVDVDLFVKFGEKYCDEQNKKTSFGKWQMKNDLHPQIIQEVFIQTDIVAGHYEIFATLYRPKFSKTKVSAYAIINPMYGERKRIDFGEFVINSSKPPYREGGGTLIGSIELTNKDFSFKKAF